MEVRTRFCMEVCVDSPNKIQKYKKYEQDQGYKAPSGHSSFYQIYLSTQYIYRTYHSLHVPSHIYLPSLHIEPIIRSIYLSIQSNFRPRLTIEPIIAPSSQKYHNCQK